MDSNPYLQHQMCPNSEMEESISETQAWKCKNKNNNKSIIKPSRDHNHDARASWGTDRRGDEGQTMTN